MELSMKENGLKTYQVSEMVVESKFGKMVLVTRVIGLTTVHVVVVV
jgi:hypothetical protein